MGKKGKRLREDKIRLKMTETADERQRRRAEKKAKKMAKRQANESVAGYSNESNPFGDVQLSEKFVWKKKVQNDAKRGIYHAKPSKTDEKRRREEIGEEIAKVKQRRADREDEHEAWEAEKERMQRDADEAEYEDYTAQEERFHLKQTRVRSQIRIREGRARPIDRIQRNLSAVGTDDFDIEVPEPQQVFNGLQPYEIAEVRDDIKTNQEFDKENTDFWTCMMTVCDDEHDARKQQQAGGGRAAAGHSGMHASIDADIQTVLKGKSVGELDDMEKSIESKIDSGGSVDVEYWEALLRKLKVQKARATLREFHGQLLRSHLNALEDAERLDTFGRDRELRGAAEEESGALSMGQDWDEDAESLFQGSGAASKPGELEAGPADTAATGVSEDGGGNDGSFSPELFEEDEIEEGAEVVDEDAAAQELESKRKEVLLQQERKRQALALPHEQRADDQADLMFKRESSKGLRENEEIFDESVELTQTYWWNDKFRPRKPRYFNRVHTGYDWNKYNQTHYDHDNPPPKVVQGYKFNLFYPDLIDRSKTPSYSLHPVDGNPDQVQIRFTAGPPYEDIAFNIVNKEWEYSFKRGFKCTFERGILHLYFNFNRARYRR
jgi:hypothetical protein